MRYNIKYTQAYYAIVNEIPPIWSYMQQVEIRETPYEGIAKLITALHN